MNLGKKVVAIGGSGGTVTSVSVVSANGISGSVANASTTPAITLSLGAIAPTSVAATGTVTGSNLSGTNTGDQTSVTGNAGTATALQTARTINGVSFDGTANITVPAVDQTARDAAAAAQATANAAETPAGAQAKANAAQAAAEGTAATALSGHVAAADPHGDRAYSVQRANHTGSQAATTITEDTTHRFTTDTEKSTWNAKVSFPGFGTTAGTAAEGNDVRLSDARTPLAHTQAWSTITTTPTTLSGYGITDAQGLDADLTALAGLSSNGLIARTADGAAATCTITGTADQVIVTNGDGVAGNPTLSLPQSIATTSTPQFAGATINGNLGILTTSPNERLTIAGAGTFGMALQQDTSTIASIKANTLTGEIQHFALTNYFPTFYSNNDERMRIDMAGNVGIGTSTPGQKLDVGGCIRSQGMQLWGSGQLQVQWCNQGDADNQKFSELIQQNGQFLGRFVNDAYNANDCWLVVKRQANSHLVDAVTFPAGNVGIGTTSPQTLLHVGSGNESTAATNPGALKVHTSGAELESVGGIELPVATDGYSVKIQGVSDSGASLVFANRAASATWTERMRINAAGNVGIGTTSPAAQLHLRSASSADIVEAIRLDNPGDAVDNGSKIVWRNADVSKDAAFFAARRIGSSNGIALTFGTAKDWSTAAATEKMRIAGNGNVGIGTTAPAARLDLGASTGVVQYIYKDDSANAGLGINLSGGSAELSLFAGATEDAAGRISFGRRRVDTGTYTERMVINAANGKVGIGTNAPDSTLEVVSPTAGVTQQVKSPGETRLFVINTTASVITELGSAGEYGYVGTYTDHPFYIRSNGVHRITIDTAGSIAFNAYGAGTLQTDSSGNVTASSDARLKNVTGDFSRGLADVLKLTPRTYHWNEKSGMNTEDENVGFIAQEVLGAVPEAVGTMKTTDYEEDDAATGKKVRKSKREAAEYLTLSDRPIIAALVNAVKELKAENDTLRARVSALENGKAAK